MTSNMCTSRIGWWVLSDHNFVLYVGVTFVHRAFFVALVARVEHINEQASLSFLSSFNEYRTL